MSVYGFRLLFHMQIPHTIKVFSLDITAKHARDQLRREFLKNAHVRDPRVIDMLVIKVCTPVCVPC